MKANGEIRHEYKGLCLTCGREFESGRVHALAAQHAKRQHHKVEYREFHLYTYDPDLPPKGSDALLVKLGLARS